MKVNGGREQVQGTAGVGIFIGECDSVIVSGEDAVVAEGGPKDKATEVV